MKLNDPKITFSDVVRLPLESAAFERAIVQQIVEIIRSQLDSVHDHPLAGPWSGPGIEEAPMKDRLGTEFKFRGLPIVRATSEEGVFTIQFIKYGRPDTKPN